MTARSTPAVSESGRNWLTGAVLILAVSASAIGGVYAKHESRKLFSELQMLNAERDRMEVDWGRLQIEQSTWSTYARVEQVAREKMSMRAPKPEQTHLLSRLDTEKADER
jgi:cell division protein FtsL